MCLWGRDWIIVMLCSVDYRIPWWTSYNLYRTRQLPLLQGGARDNHITPVLKKLHWLPVKYRAQYKLLVHTYKALFDHSHVYLEDMVQVYTPDRTLRSYRKRCFNYAALSIWNVLSPDIRESKTTDSSAWNPLFSTMGQIDQVDRRFNLDPTTPNCIYLGTLK